MLEVQKIHKTHNGYDYLVRVTMADLIIRAEAFVRLVGSPVEAIIYGHNAVTIDGQGYGRLGSEPQNERTCEDEAYALIEELVPMLKYMDCERKLGVITYGDKWVATRKQEAPIDTEVLFYDRQDGKQKRGQRISFMQGMTHILEGVLINDAEGRLGYWRDMPRKPNTVIILERHKASTEAGSHNV
jgi:hypothetical protein